MVLSTGRTVVNILLERSRWETQLASYSVANSRSRMLVKLCFRTIQEEYTASTRSTVINCRVRYTWSACSSTCWFFLPNTCLPLPPGPEARRQIKCSHGSNIKLITMESKREPFDSERPHNPLMSNTTTFYWYFQRCIICTYSVQIRKRFTSVSVCSF
jgi:hypothetical protein